MARQTRKRKMKRWCGGGFKENMELQTDKFKFNPLYIYYLKLGTFQYLDDDDQPVLKKMK